MDRSLLPLCRGLIRFGSWFVPAPSRRDWSAEWIAEIAFAWRIVSAGPPAARWALLGRCLGAIPDGLCLLAAEWLPALQSDALIAAFRDLARRPFHFGAAVFSLALALGAAAGTLSATRLLLRPALPFPEADRYVRLEHAERIEGAVARPFSRAEFVTLRRDCSASFEILSASRRRAERFHGPHGATVVVTGETSPESFTLVPVLPHLGRGLQSGDVFPGADPVAVLSHELWLAEFAGARSAVGSLVTVGGAPRRIVGVMPPEFGALERGTQVWLPLTESSLPERRASSRDLQLVGRLRHGVPAHEARQAVADALSSCATTGFAPTAFGGIDVVQLAPPLGERLPRAMMMACLLTPCLAAVPLTSGVALLGARAGRRRLSGALVLAALAFAVAIPLGSAVAATIERTLPPRADLPAFSVDAGIVAFLACATLTALLRLARPRVGQAVAALSAALAILLVSLGVLRDVRPLASRPIAIDTNGWWVAYVHLEDATNAEAASRIRESVGSIEGVKDVCVTGAAPFDGVMRSVSVLPADGAPGSAPVDAVSPIEAALRTVDDDYFRALGLAVEGEGRTTRGAIVNRALAERLGLEAGASIEVFLDEWTRLPIVGIADGPWRDAERVPVPEVFVDFDRAGPRTEPNSRRVALIVHAPEVDDPTPLHTALRGVLQRDGAAVGSLRRLDSSLERMQCRPRAAMQLAGLGFVFAAALAGLSVLGLFGPRAARFEASRRDPGID